MDINTIKQLREQTGAGIMEVKKALQEQNNDPVKAADALRKAGFSRADKRSSRDASNGIVASYIHQDGEIGVLLELNCETSFVAKTNEFKALAHELSLQIAAMNPNSVEVLLAQDSIRSPKQKIDDLLKSVSAKTGEKVQIKRYTRYQVGSTNSND